MNTAQRSKQTHYNRSDILYGYEPVQTPQIINRTFFQSICCLGAGDDLSFMYDSVTEGLGSITSARTSSYVYVYVYARRLRFRLLDISKPCEMCNSPFAQFRIRIKCNICYKMSRQLFNFICYTSSDEHQLKTVGNNWNT